MDSSNFRFLLVNQPELAKLGESAEEYVYSDPQSAVVKLRCFAELYVGFIYQELNLPTNGAKSLFELLGNPTFENAVERCVIDKLHLIRMKGNKAAHPAGVGVEDALLLVKETFFLAAWIHVSFHGGKIEELPRYIKPNPIKPPGETLKDNFARTQDKLIKQTADLAKAKAELERVQRRLVAAQQRLTVQNIEVNYAKLEQVQIAGQQAVANYDFEPEKTKSAISMADVFAGYQLTDGQTELVKLLDGFLAGRESNVFLLRGYAGTGKTFITKGLTEYFRAIGRNYVLAAPTGKASKVIASKTKSPAFTIHKTIYSFKDIKEYIDHDLSGSETYKFYAELAVNELSVDTVYIVDEASMIADNYNESEFFQCGSGYLLRDFLKFVNLDHNDHRKKVIFIGDNAQLPPVGMKTSPALDPKYLSTEYGLTTTGYELTEVVRQKLDSGVMHNAINMRKSLKENVFNQLDFDLAAPDVEHVEHSELIQKYLNSCGHRISGESIIIAHSNADVTSYNKRIREEFFPENLQVCAGDKVMAVTNSDSYGFFISNGDFGQIRHVENGPEVRSITLKRKSGETGEVEEINVSLQFRDVEVGFRDLEGNVHFFSAKIIENLLYSDTPTLSSDENKALYLDFCIRHSELKRGSMEFKQTLRSDPYFNALRLKFGYAITCHKAQGSEWNHVFVKCNTHQHQLCAEYFRWLYTAITRTANHLYLLEEPHLKLGAGIKPVFDPGIGGVYKGDTREETKIQGSLDSGKDAAHDDGMPSEPTPNVKKGDGSFGIPRTNEFLSALLVKVQTVVSSAGVEICDIQHQQFQEAYFFIRGDESARVNFSYNSHQKITAVVLPQPTELGGELLALLHSLEGRVLTSPLAATADSIEFDESFLNEFHQLLCTSAHSEEISIANVEELQYAQRYWFQKEGDVAVVDIYYNKRKRFTSCDPKKNLTTSRTLLKQVLTLITEKIA